MSRAITNDRNANSAANGRGIVVIVGLRQERHTVNSRWRETARSPDPNSIHQEDIWTHGRSSFAPSCSFSFSLSSSSTWVDRCLPRRLLGLANETRKRRRVRSRPETAPSLARQPSRDSDGNYSSSGICCELPAKIAAKKRINVTGEEKESEQESGRRRRGENSTLIFLSDNCRGDN